MTLIKTSLIAVFGLFAAGTITPASAVVATGAQPAVVLEDAASSVHLATDRRGSWSERRRDSHRDHRSYSHDRRHDDHRYQKHYKKKRQVYNRGYQRGYRDSRRDYRYRRHSHSRHQHNGFRGSIYFGDGHFSAGSFRFRY